MYVAVHKTSGKMVWSSGIVEKDGERWTPSESKAREVASYNTGLSPDDLILHLIEDGQQAEEINQAALSDVAVVLDGDNVSSLLIKPAYVLAIDTDKTSLLADNTDTATITLTLKRPDGSLVQNDVTLDLPIRKNDDRLFRRVTVIGGSLAHFFRTAHTALWEIRAEDVFEAMRGLIPTDNRLIITGGISIKVFEQGAEN